MGDIKQWESVVTDFLKHLLETRGPAAELRVLRDLRKLAEKGHALRDITEKLEDGLIELKTSHNKMEYRCIYVHRHPDIIILICFEKKKQKTPRHFIDLAKKRHSQILREELELGKVVLH